MAYLTTWNPFRNPGVSLQRDMNDLLDRFFGDGGRMPRADFDFAPTVDVEETPSEFIVHAELPGLTEKDVKVTLTGDLLVIRGEKKVDREKKDRTYHASERVSGSFERTFRLPTPVKGNEVKASFQNGLLTVTVPKADEVMPRQIEVKVSK